MLGSTAGAFLGETNLGREDAFLIKLSANGSASIETPATGGGCSSLSGSAAKLDVGLLLLGLLMPALLLARLKSTP